MPGSSFGEMFRVTTFGESHGPPWDALSMVAHLDCPCARRIYRLIWIADVLVLQNMRLKGRRQTEYEYSQVYLRALPREPASDF